MSKTKKKGLPVKPKMWWSDEKRKAWDDNQWEQKQAAEYRRKKKAGLIKEDIDQEAIKAQEEDLIMLKEMYGDDYDPELNPRPWE